MVDLGTYCLELLIKVYFCCGFSFFLYISSFVQRSIILLYRVASDRVRRIFLRNSFPNCKRNIAESRPGDFEYGALLFDSANSSMRHSVEDIVVALFVFTTVMYVRVSVCGAARQAPDSASRLAGRRGRVVTSRVDEADLWPAFNVGSRYVLQLVIVCRLRSDS